AKATSDKQRAPESQGDIGGKSILVRRELEDIEEIPVHVEFENDSAHVAGRCRQLVRSWAGVEVHDLLKRAHGEDSSRSVHSDVVRDVFTVASEPLRPHEVARRVEFPDEAIATA